MHPKRFCVFLMIVVALSAATASAGLFGRRLVQPIQIAEPQSRVTTLPEDSSAGYITLMVHSDWKNRPAEAAMVEKWQSMPEVAELAETSHRLIYTEKDAMYQNRLKADNPVLPAIVVQAADGRVIFKDHGDTLPATDVNVDVGRNQRPVVLPWNRRANPSPTPAPKPDVNVVVAPSPVPDKVPIQKPAESSSSGIWLLIGLVVLVVTAITFAVQFHKRVNKVK